MFFQYEQEAKSNDWSSTSEWYACLNKLKLGFFHRLCSPTKKWIKLIQYEEHQFKMHFQMYLHPWRQVTFWRNLWRLCLCSTLKSFCKYTDCIGCEGDCIISGGRHVHHCLVQLLTSLLTKVLSSCRKFLLSHQKNIQPEGITTLSWFYTQTRTSCSPGNNVTTAPEEIFSFTP